MKLLVLCALVAGACASEWNYDDTSAHGPDDWEDDCNLLTRVRQSPIDIDPSAALSLDDNYAAFLRTGYTGVDVTLKNNGHTIVAELGSTANALLSGGGLEGVYQLDQFHFHWGSANGQGSEHFIDNVQYDMEVHFVHHNVIYGDITSAAGECDGLAVLSWLFSSDGSGEAIEAYDTIFNEVAALEEGSSVSLTNLNIENLMGAMDGPFYRYQGSLTTPPCYQSVKWTVFMDTLHVTADQLAEMRLVEDTEGHHVSDNFRPIQATNDRVIYY